MSWLRSLRLSIFAMSPRTSTQSPRDLLVRLWWRSVFDGSTLESKPKVVGAVLPGLKILSLEIQRIYGDPSRIKRYRITFKEYGAGRLEREARLVEFALAFDEVRRLGLRELHVILWDRTPESSWVRGDLKLEKILKDSLMEPREICADQERS